MLSSEIDLLMYSTFAVQSDESARQQCLTFVLPYVLLWSNRAVIHLANDDSLTDPPQVLGCSEDPRLLPHALDLPERKGTALLTIPANPIKLRQYWDHWTFSLITG